jgi:hypothetical protein
VCVTLPLKRQGQPCHVDTCSPSSVEHYHDTGAAARRRRSHVLTIAGNLCALFCTLLANSLGLLYSALCRISRSFSRKLTYLQILLLITSRSVSILQGTRPVETDKGIVATWQIGFWSRVTRQTQEVVINGMTRMSFLLLLCPANKYDSIW